MDTTLVYEKEEHLPDRPIPSLRNFLELLVPPEEILEYKEFVGGERDSFDYHIWLSSLKRGCFLLDFDRAGISAAGFVDFSRSRQSWIASEDLTFELWFLHYKHASLAEVQGSNSPIGWSMRHGWKMLSIGWSVITRDGQQTSPEHLNLRASGLNSKTTSYCLAVIERAKAALGKIK